MWPKYDDWAEHTVESLLRGLARSLQIRIDWTGRMVERKMTQEQYEKKYPFHLVIPNMQCVSDVISTLEALTELPSKNTRPFSEAKAVAALAAEVLGEVVVYTLTTHTNPVLSEVSFARLVTRHFARCGTTQKSLKDLLNIFVASRQLQNSEKSE